MLRTLLGWYRDGEDIEARLPLLSTVLGHVHPADTFWYFEGAPELLALACERLERTWEAPSPAGTSDAQARMPLSWERSRRSRPSPDAPRKGPAMSALAPLLQAYFTERLARQRDASPHTIASYRDSFRLLLTFLHEQTSTPPSKLQLEDLDPARITAFLSYLENERGNSVRTRNARLTAIHSFFHFAAFKAPECSERWRGCSGSPRSATSRRHQLSNQARDRRVADRPGPFHPDRPARPRLATPGGADRAQGL